MQNESQHPELIERNVARTIKSKRMLDRFRCVCGGSFVAALQDVKRGFKTSCGCRTKELISKANCKHGYSRDRLYSIWRGMKKRCNLVSHQAYPRYGGADIHVCDEWYKFENFLDWALSSGYESQMTIDRINNSDGYLPSNCRWVKRSDQNRNKSNNVLNVEISRVATRLYASGLKCSELAKLFSIGRPTMSYMLCGKTWSDCTSDIRIQQKDSDCFTVPKGSK